MNLSDKDSSILPLLTRLWCQVSVRRRYQFLLLLILMLIVSLLEVISIGAVIPFLGVLTTPELVYERIKAYPFFHDLGVTTPSELIWPVTVVFCLVSLAAGVMRLLLLWLNSRLSYDAGADLSFEVYRRTLYQPYEVHCSRSSSEIIDGIMNKTSVAISVINNILALIGSVGISFFVFVAFFYFNPLTALGIFFGLIFVYLFIFRLSRKRISLNSKVVATESARIIKALQEGLGGIRDILIDGTQDLHTKIYLNSDLPLRRAQARSVFIITSPRYLLESTCIVLIALIAYKLSRNSEGLVYAIPYLGALALGLQRLLPALQQSYSSWATIKVAQASLRDALNLLEQPLPINLNNTIPVRPISFDSEIYLNNVGFSYKSDQTNILKGVNLKIPKGSRIGIVGLSGSGKSTLVDIIMGLLRPTEGDLLIDKLVVNHSLLSSWQSHIAHVPQTVFLSDATIEENIAFGTLSGNIDMARVIEAARGAQIENVIQGLPQKYKTIVGERGIRLSGGQRQRIGIARALYKRADVLIFDEATSALDSGTEQSVMQAIENLSDDLTIIIIAHRISTLRNCSRIIEVRDGKIYG
jgi:ABC-type multidrug transport system fused ATPase/permease subunit